MLTIGETFHHSGYVVVCKSCSLYGFLCDCVATDLCLGLPFRSEVLVTEASCRELLLRPRSTFVYLGVLSQRGGARDRQLKDAAVGLDVRSCGDACWCRQWWRGRCLSVKASVGIYTGRAKRKL